MPVKQCQRKTSRKIAVGWVGYDAHLLFLAYIVQLCLEVSNPIPCLRELYFAKPSVTPLDLYPIHPDLNT